MSAVAFSHQSICVSDRERSKRFYSEALGFTLDHSLPIGPECEGITELTGLDSAADFMLLGPMKIELLSYVSPAPVGPATRRPMNSARSDTFVVHSPQHRRNRCPDRSLRRPGLAADPAGNAARRSDVLHRPGRRAYRAVGENCLIEAANGASDGARTRDLRRDRPAL